MASANPDLLGLLSNASSDEYDRKLKALKEEFVAAVEGDLPQTAIASTLLAAFSPAPVSMILEVADAILFDGFVDPDCYGKIPLWMQNVVWTRIFTFVLKEIVTKDTPLNPGIKLFSPAIAMLRMADPVHRYAERGRKCFCPENRVGYMIWGWECVPTSITAETMAQAVKARVMNEWGLER